MIGSAIRKPRIQPGRGSARADSMIEGRTTVMGTPACDADEGPLAERLGEGVGVGPPEGLGPGPAGLDQLRAHPVVAQLLGPLGQDVGPGRAQLGAGRLGEPSPGGSGRRDSDSRSARSRRAESISAAMSTSVVTVVCVRALAPDRTASVKRVSVASPWWVPAT